MADDDSDSDEARVPRPLQAAACAYRIAFGPRAGQKVLTVQGAMPRDADFKQTLCADIDGFGLHAAVCCGAYDRVQTNAAGQVVLKLNTPPGETAPRTWWSRRWSSCSGLRHWCHAHACT